MHRSIFISMKRKIDSLQTLRFLACLSIFVHHCYLAQYIEYSGVSVFFVMSGFLMYCNYIDREPMSLSPLACTRFSIKKISRLYPLHVLTMLPILALDIYVGHDAAHLVTETVANLLLVQTWLTDYAQSLNGVAWYLSVSLFLYFAFPYILHLVKRLKSRRSAFIAIAVLILCQALFAFTGAPMSIHFLGRVDETFTDWYGYNLPITRCFEFAIGCVLGRIFLTRRDGECEGRAASLALELSGVALIAAAILLHRRFDYVPYVRTLIKSVFFMPASCVLVYLFAVGKGLIPRLLTNRVTIFLGNVSAAFFLIHQDLIRATYMLLDRAGLSLDQCKPIFFFGCGAISIGLSYLYDCIDRRIRDKKRLSA